MFEFGSRDFHSALKWIPNSEHLGMLKDRCGVIKFCVLFRKLVTKTYALIKQAYKEVFVSTIRSVPIEQVLRIN